MKFFPPAYTAEMARLDGAQPIWILRLTVAAVDYWLSDNAITVPAFAGSSPWPAATVINTVALVKLWGTIQEGISGALGEFHIADFSLDVIIDPLITPNMETLAPAAAAELSTVELYKWYLGCTDPPQRQFTGCIRDLGNLTDTTASLSIQDESIKLEKTFIGTKITAAVYPEAAEADIGKIIPIPFGGVSKSPAMAFDIGVQTLLTADCTSTATMLSFANTDRFFTGMILLIESEQVQVSSISGLTAWVTRHYASSTATKHSKGAAVVELSTQTYVSSARALNSIDRVWLKVSDESRFDITAYCTRYTGIAGAGCPGYGLPGVQITPTNMLSILGIVQLQQVDTIGVDTGSHTHGAEQSRTQVATNQGVNYGGGATLNVLPAYPSISGVEIEETNFYEFWYWGSGNAKNVYVNGNLVESGLASNTSGVKWSGTTVGTPYIRIDDTGSPYSTVCKIVSASRTIAFTANTDTSPATGVAKTGGVVLSGSALTSYFGSGKIFVDQSADSGDLIGMGTWILAQAGLPAPVMSGSLPPYYTLNGVITDYQSALTLLNQIAFQCRCWFAMSNGAARFIVRGTFAPVKTISACIITEDGNRQLTRKLTDVADVIKKITILFDRDWSQARSDKAYASAYTVPGSTDGDERPELFQFDFVTGITVASEVGAFYLAQYNVRRWLAEFPEPLQHSDLEFGDTVQLGFLDNKIAVITNASHAPGSSETADTIKLTATY